MADTINFKDLNHVLSDSLLKRFLSYVQIWTTSDENAALEKTPSTECQWDLIHLLENQLKELGLDDVFVDKHGYIIARIPSNRPTNQKAPCIGFMAHVDTNADAPGKNIQPLVHRNYDGRPIDLKHGIVIDPLENPELNRYVGQTIITADGNTLLGADDKAGVAEIMAAATWMLDHPEIPHGEIEIIFTPDEETGLGMNRFPLKKLKSQYCFTIDGGQEGALETECYYARKALITFLGRVIHPESARGKLINAVSMAGSFISMLPRNESPEATDGRFGNYWAHKVSGELEKAELTVFFRDFELENIQRRIDALYAFGHAVEMAFPGGKVQVDIVSQYENMRTNIDSHPEILENLRKAYSLSGITPVEKPIRGGTDGSKLTAMGIPTPNIFAGGQNFHSRYEWIALPAMVRAVAVMLNLAVVWS